MIDKGVHNFSHFANSYFSLRAAKTKPYFLCQSVDSGCVLFVMKWCEHIINSQRKVTWSQRSIDRADSDVKWLDMQRAPSGPRGEDVTIWCHIHITWCDTRTADILAHLFPVPPDLTLFFVYVFVFILSIYPRLGLNCCWHAKEPPRAEPMPLLSPRKRL